MAVGKYRNQMCPCNSGKKYKRCHYGADYWTGFTKVTVTKVDKKTKEEIEKKIWMRSQFV